MDDRPRDPGSAVKSRTWLVTGGTGFLGRQVVRELVERGDRVRALVRATPEIPLPGVDLQYGDVLAEETLGPAMDGVDGVFHLAGRVLREGGRDVMLALHVDGTANVLRAMQASGVRRVVYASTSGTVAVSTDPVTHGDDAPFADKIVESWAYYASKIHAEHVADKMAERLGLELVTLRPSLLLGPDDHNASSTDDVRKFIAGELPVVPQGGVSFLDVRDCAATFCKAMDVARPGEKYLLGAANLTLRDFFTLVANVADVRPPAAELPPALWKWGVRAVHAAAWLGYVEKPDRVTTEMASHYWYCDWSRACADLGHAPRPPIETIEDTVAWLRSQADLTEKLAETGQLLRLPFRRT